MKLFLQERWKLEGKKLEYYGLRQGKNMFRGERAGSERRLYKKGVLVEEKDLRKTPKNFEEARFCTSCCMNDFMVPGVEFDEEGRCPICAAKDDKKLVSILPVVNEISKSKTGKYDAAVFYTGGKDSTFLLYYLSTVKKLRVLALTWHIPFMSDSAMSSIENAKKAFPDADFVIDKIYDESLKKVYKKLMELKNDTCACPSLAYFLFYELLIKEKVPYLILGNEPAQMRNLYYNHMAPKAAFLMSGSKFFNFLISCGRVLTFKKPFRRGQFHMLEVVKQLAFKDNKLKEITGYQNELVSNVCVALKEAPEILEKFQKTVKKSIRSASMPALVHIDFHSVSEGGVYNWQSVKELLQKNTGWVPNQTKGLHTSCKIERVKEYAQFERFYNMKSKMIPFSAIEISIACREGSISREEAIAELKGESGFSLTPPEEYKYIKDYLSR